MSVRVYPAYKDSGVEWLSEVPTHWSLRRLGFYFSERREKVSDRDYPALSVTKNGIVPQLETAAKSDDGDNRKRVCAGDFVINGRSDRKGSSGLSALDGSVSLINLVLQPHQTIDMEFVGHLLKSPLFQEEFYRYGKGIVADLWSTNFSEMRNILLAIPPAPEQSAIAAFLDRETGKIDALVAEQERLMALLKEKRQAVISQAVTKGLNPNAKMKPSGVEWLGEVPEHWKVSPLRYLAKIGNGSTPSRENASYWLGGAYPWLTSSHVNRDYIYDSSEFITGVALKECHLPQIAPPAVLIGITGQGRTRGMASTLRIEATISQHIAFLKPDEHIIYNDYLRFAMDNLYDFLRNESDGGGSTKGAITCEQLANVRIPLPDLQEQAAICELIHQNSIGMAKLFSEAEHAIALLKERRAALISAAVTGKIDVRDLADTQRDAA